MGVPTAAELAHVSRETIARYERDPMLVKNAMKRAACAWLYGRLRLLIVESAERKRLLDADDYDDEECPATLPGSAVAAALARVAC